jgi:hypothetical protein
MIKKILFKLKKAFGTISVGKRVLVHYPIEDEYVEVEVSSIMFNSFYAKFIDDKEPSSIDTWKYGQCFDNDILYDMKTYQPIDMHDRK